MNDALFQFFRALPAVLGVVVFVIYFLLKRSIAEDPIVRAIIEKLQFTEPDFANRWAGLDSAQKESLLKSDNRFREKISLNDRKLLGRVLNHQFITKIFVYSLSGALLIAGIYFYLQPKPLFIDSIQVQNTDTKSRDFIVDIDPITVTWTSTGTNGEVFAVLENIETGNQTKRIRGQASDGKIKFNADKYTNYDKILSNRFPNETNRLRAILYTNKESFQSKDFEVKVGVKIICYEHKPNKLIFNAIVDQTIIENFHFAPRLNLFKDEHFNGSTLFEAKSYSSQPELIIASPNDFSTSNLAFTANPRDIVDRNVYRTDIQSLRDAIKALQTK